MEEAERMERRERDKRERAKMSLTQNQKPEPEMPSCLFSAPFRVRYIFKFNEKINICVQKALPKSALENFFYKYGRIYSRRE